MALTAAAANLADAAIENGASATSVAVIPAESEMLLVEHSEAEHSVIVARVAVAGITVAARTARQAAQHNR